MKINSSYLLTTKEVRLLWDVGDARDMSPEKLAAFVGVGFKSIYRWFAGQKPNEAQRQKISCGIALIESEVPVVTARRSSPADERAAAANRAFNAALRAVFYQLQAATSNNNEKRLVAKAWPDFVEVLTLLKKFNISIPRKARP